jgi:hypothetical protein
MGIAGRFLAGLSPQEKEIHPEELNTFNTSHDGMTMGWTGTFEELGEYLAKV